MNTNIRKVVKTEEATIKTILYCLVFRETFFFCLKLIGFTGHSCGNHLQLLLSLKYETFVGGG